MKHFASLLGSLCCAAALAQAAPPTGTTEPEALARERARIEAQRQREQVRFAGEESACYQRFAVNDCLRDVRAHRRAALEELRRQEIELNDAQRSSRAAERLRRLGEGPTASPAGIPPAVRASEPAPK